MNDQASQPSVPQPAAQVLQPEPPKRRHVALGCGGCATVLVVLLIAGGSCSRNPDVSARDAAYSLVKQHVVSPESLKIKFADCEIAARSTDGQYRVVYVPFSAQNRFGVQLPGYMLALVMELRGKSEVLGKEMYERPPTKADLQRWMGEIRADWEVEEWAR